KPSALSSRVLPTARAVQQEGRYRPAMAALLRPCVVLCAETWAATVRRCRLRRRSGRRTSRALARRTQQPTPKATTTSNGPRRSAELVAQAEIDSGSIATASTNSERDGNRGETATR